MNLQKQKGMTVVGMVITLVIVALLLIVGIKTVPVYTEYRVLNKVAKYAAQGESVSEIRGSFMGQLRREGISNPPLDANDIQVTTRGGQTIVSFAYYREVSLVGDTVFLLFKLSGEQTGSRI